MNYKTKLSKIRAFIFDCDGVLTDGTITLMPNGEQLRKMNTKDGYALQLAVKKKYIVSIITGGSSKAVKNRMNRLGIKDVYLSCNNKIDALNELVNIYNLKTEEILYMGDDLPDYEVMQRVGCPTCPSNAVQEIKILSDYISNKKGGDGCVRDIIEQTMKLHGKWVKNTITPSI